MPTLLLTALLMAPAQTAGLRVTVMADFSVFTKMEAENVVLRLALAKVPAKQASAVLVVVRSVLPLPLRARYDSLCELREDAERQLNIAGPKYHVYLFRLADDLSLSRLDHVSYKAE